MEHVLISGASETKLELGLQAKAAQAAWSEPDRRPGGDHAAG